MEWIADPRRASARRQVPKRHLTAKANAWSVEL